MRWMMEISLLKVEGYLVEGYLVRSYFVIGNKLNDVNIIPLTLGNISENFL
jgi:hypothetical protein